MFYIYSYYAELFICILETWKGIRAEIFKRTQDTHYAFNDLFWMEDYLYVCACVCACIAVLKFKWWFNLLAG